MIKNPNHHVCIHGHFYQPPRENPWLGIIEDQDSALPFANWNARINAECYQPLTSSAVTDANGEVSDLFNCYAHLSFNFGPTLLAWLEKESPECLTRLRTADELAQQSYGGSGAAIAQGYNHMILPLADSADRVTQIIWGIREFSTRFGRSPESIWLPETAINMATVSALITAGIKFVILSPFQASYTRKFGTEEWTGVPDGTIDTRLPYRLFEVDGAGRTHFDRYLDVFFYDKDLSTKVSFAHLLANADRLEEETYRRFAPAATLPQLVLIATDGEIYGHHEKFGNRALAYFLSQNLRQQRITVSNLGQYLRENPPQCEVRLWEGLDGRGSSWSCSHGVARWSRDCGCGGNGVWNQEWRTPLRHALEHLKNSIREITRRELGRLVYDVRDARNDYINVILNPSDATREAFIGRHAQKELTAREKVTLWSLLEAERYSMLMFTSCGWFFDEISGVEPVQNLRYALRAACLCAPYAETDLVNELRNHLAPAMSNIPEQGNGADVFDRLVLPTHYSRQTIAAVYVLSRMLELDTPQYNVRVEMMQENLARRGNTRLASGQLRTTDIWTTSCREFLFCGAVFPNGRAAVCFPSSAEEQKKILALKDQELEQHITSQGVNLSAMPYADRWRFAKNLFGNDYTKARMELQKIHNDAIPLLEKLALNRLPIPQSLRAVGENALRQQLNLLVKEISASDNLRPEHFERVRKLRDTAARTNLNLPTVEAATAICKITEEKTQELSADFTVAAAKELLNTLRLGKSLSLPMASVDRLRDRFWRVLHMPQHPAQPELRDILRDIAAELGFVHETTEALLDRLLP